MEDDPMIGTVVRLEDAPGDSRSGAFFRVTDAWGDPRRYAAHQFLGLEPPPGEHVRIVRGGLWNVTIEEPLEPTAATAPMPPPAPPTSSAPATPLPLLGPRRGGLGDLFGIHTADALLSRRQTWVGASIKAINVPTTDPSYGSYWRVRESWRDQDGTFHIASDYLGTERPPGPVYLFDGTTWDMPTMPSTVFPYLVPIATAALLGLASVVLFAIGGMNNVIDEGYLGRGLGIVIFGGFAAFLVVAQTLWSWFYRVEPVRGSKVLAGMAAVHYARRTHHEPTYEELIQPPWIKDQAARREAERQGSATAVAIDQAIAKALEHDRSRREQA